MPFSTREKKLLAGFLCVLALLFLWYRNAGTQTRASGLTEPLEPELSVEERPPVAEEAFPEEAYVHISGCVNRPGLYRCDTETRVADVVELAGGFLPDADQTNINLAKKVRDEEKIHIPATGEEPLPTFQGDSGSAGGLININTAEVKDLTELPGIGEKTAEKIIRYREETPFGAIEDLKNVPGIGDKKFEELKDMITY